MPLTDIYRAVRDQTRDQRNSLRANNEKLLWRFMDVFARTWDLGFTVCCDHSIVLYSSHSIYHSINSYQLTNAYTVLRRPTRSLSNPAPQIRRRSRRQDKMDR